jgi:hypothetical protein
MGESYPPLQAWRRILILLLAVATGVAMVLMLLHPPGGVKRTRLAVQAPAECAAGQSSGCVGGKADVIFLRPQPSAASKQR